MLAGVAWIPRASAQRVSARAAAPSPAPRLSAAQVARIQAISAEIREQAGGRIEKFYEARGFRPLWSATGSIGEEAEALIGFFETASLDGLKPSSYKVKELRKAIAQAQSGNPKDVAKAELKLSKSFARYAIDLRRRSRVEMLYADARLLPRKLHEDDVLRAAGLPQPFRHYIFTMGWMSPHYVRMRGLLARGLQQGATEQAEARLRLNVERARLLPGAWASHVVVDAGVGRLWYYQAGQEAGTMKVIVGKPATATPMMAGMIQYAIVNPYWNIPDFLVRQNTAPKVLAGRSLESLKMEALSDWSANPRKIDARTIDWRAVAAGTQEVRLRQLPGPFNSMGKVKYLFPNSEGIYMHDTPEKDLFARSDRHYSNGCIRLEDAARLGRWLLGKPVPARSRLPEQAIALTAPVPVYVTYFTAETDAAGTGVALRPDIYGRDLVR